MNIIIPLFYHCYIYRFLYRSGVLFLCHLVRELSINLETTSLMYAFMRQKYMNSHNV